jgi:NADH:ubiquinone reductase (H+-translocating)
METTSGGLLPRVVIVGGGFGGLRAARALRHAPVRVTLVDRGNHHLFQPLLYQVATAELSPADISAPIRGVLRRQRNAEVALAEVTGVDVDRHRISLHDLATGHARALDYDYLIIATGAGTSYFGHDEWERFAPGLKTIEDATAIRRDILLAFEAAEAECAEGTESETRASDLLTFVIVGGGPTGVELAGAIAEVARKALVSDFRHIRPADARVVLVEAAPHILATYPVSLAERARRKLERLGVEVRTGARVESIDESGVLVDGERLAAHTIIWAAGVRASPAGEWLRAPTDRAGRVLVGPDLTIPEHPNVFVIGDAASASQNGAPLPGIAPVAMQQGRYAAKAIRRRIAGERDIPPFHYFDKGTMATVGRSFAVARIRRLSLSGFLAWALWLGIHILFLIGFRNRALVLFQWAWAYLTYQRGARLITHLAAAARVPAAVPHP